MAIRNRFQNLITSSLVRKRLKGWKRVPQRWKTCASMLGTRASHGEHVCLRKRDNVTRFSPVIFFAISNYPFGPLIFVLKHFWMCHHIRIHTYIESSNWGLNNRLLITWWFFATRSHIQNQLWLCGVISNSAVSYQTLRCQNQTLRCHIKLCSVISNSPVTYQTLRCHIKLCSVNDTA